MTAHKKLSVYLNGYYSYYKIKEAKSGDVPAITHLYIQGIEDKIFKQPDIALRSIKVELNDIHIHYDRYIKELEEYVSELNLILSKGPKLDKINLDKATELEEKKNVLVEFVYLIEDSFAYMIRMLLAHYSELDNDQPFLDKYSKHLGRFDWMHQRVERSRKELRVNAEHDSVPPLFENDVIKEAKKLIENNEVPSAIKLLMKNRSSQIVESEIILISLQWKDYEKNKFFGRSSEEESSKRIKIIQKNR